VGALEWGHLDTLFCCLVSTELENKYCKRKQTARAVTVIGRLMPQVKGVSGLGGGASAPKGANVL
jgi:hypothetical protein